MAKNWFISGASSGLGRLMAEKLLTRGDRVAGTVRGAGALDDLMERHGDRLTVLMLDVTDTEAVRTVIARAFAAMASPAVLACVTTPAPIVARSGVRVDVPVAAMSAIVAVLPS